MCWDTAGSRVYFQDCPSPRQLVLLLHKLQFGKAMGGRGRRMVIPRPTLTSASRKLWQRWWFAIYRKCAKQNEPLTQLRLRAVTIPAEELGSTEQKYLFKSIAIISAYHHSFPSSTVSFIFASPFAGLCPKIVLPTLISLLPHRIALSKSSLIPILNSKSRACMPNSFTT